MKTKGLCMWALVVVTSVTAIGAQEPSLTLADGGLRFPDGSVQATAALGGPPAPVPRTGSSLTHGSGDDGDLRMGVVWPNPRFTVNGNGTVTDNLTDLIWLADADCFGDLMWQDAIAKAAALFDGCGGCGGTNNDCGLTDGSVAGQWRLPNVLELHSLVHYGVWNPALPNTSGTGHWAPGDPFLGVQPYLYWSSTTAFWGWPDILWCVDFDWGGITVARNTETVSAWLVRGGQ